MSRGRNATGSDQTDRVEDGLSPTPRSGLAVQACGQFGDPVMDPFQVVAGVLQRGLGVGEQREWFQAPRVVGIG